jgi:excisionase family DNA binding protein
MRQSMGAQRPRTDERQFRSVAEAARVFGVSEMTLYRAIREGQFPAVRIMGRLIVPLRAIEAMVDAAIEHNELVDAADWVDRPIEQSPPGPRQVLGRPRPGANQTGAGSFSTQHVAGHGENATLTGRDRSRGGVA